jgi:[ribosomal protein S18]-alanine N-acetyltransferase
VALGQIVAAVRPAVELDLPALDRIEQESFADHWAAKSFLEYSCIVAEIGSEIVGFLVSREIFAGSRDAPPEREILNLAVAARFRRQGIAGLLLGHELGKRAIYYLEVRESNTAARALYSKFGFREINRRTGYYRHPPETAIVMKMN